MNVQKHQTFFRQKRTWLILPAALVFALCAMMLYGGGSLYWGPTDSDLTNQFYPWRVFVHRWIMRGIVPYWDPHIFSGYPAIETQQMMALNPVHLMTLWMPPNLGLIAVMVANTLIACIGMAWALYRWGRSTIMAAAIGAAVYTFGALFAVRVMAGHFTVVAALAWWPLAAISVMRITRLIPDVSGRLFAGNNKETLSRCRWLFAEIGRCRDVLLAAIRSSRFRRILAISAVAHGMVCLSGGPQYIVYLFYIDLAVIIASSRRPNIIPALIVTASAWIFALLISAPQWLPTLWYLPYTGRAMTSGGATGWNIATFKNLWLETLLPFPFGDDLTYGHLHFKNVWETALYPGSLPIIFSVAILTRWAGWITRRFIGRGKAICALTPLSMAGVCILLSGVYMMAGGWLPGFGGFREPLKARAVVAFGFALISAASFDGMIRRPGQWRRPLIFAIIVLIYAIAGALDYANPEKFLALIQSFRMPMDPHAAVYYESVLKDPTDAIQHYWLACNQACIGLYVTGLFLWQIRKRRHAVATWLFVIAILDPFFANAPAWFARHPWNEAALPKPVAEYFAPRLEDSRRNNELPWRVMLHSAIINRTHHLEGFYEFRGYDPLMPAFAVGHMLVKGVTKLSDSERLEFKDTLFRHVGIRYDAEEWLPSNDRITTAPAVHEIPGASLIGVSRSVVAGSPGLNIFGPDIHGRNYVMPPDSGGQMWETHEIIPAFQTKIDSLFSSTTEADNTSTATGDIQLHPDESIAYVNGGRPDECELKLKLVSPALVTYKTTWLPGWRISIDGDDQGQALFANNWMCGAIVPKGEHTLLYRYRPMFWKSSWLLSAFGLAGVIGLLLYRRKSRHAIPQPSQKPQV